MEEKGFTKFIKLVFEVFFNSVKDTSPPKKLHDVDYAKISRNAIIFGTGAGITYILQQFISVDFGPYTPLIVGGIAGILDVLRRALKNNLL